MPRLSERGVVQIVFVLILLAGIVAGVYLVQHTQIFKPKAATSTPITPEASFSLRDPAESYNSTTVGSVFSIKLLVRSDIDPANLFSAKINYDKDLLSVDHIDFINENLGIITFIQNWIEQRWDEPGKISLVGGVPNPGYQTNISDPRSTMAVLYFKALKEGEAKVYFDETSAIYRNSDNLNILTIKNNTSEIITSNVKSSPSPTPTCPSGRTDCPPTTPPPTAVCPYGSTQARVQKNLQDPWDKSKTINVGEQIRVGGFHDNTGLFAKDVRLDVKGGFAPQSPESFSNLENGGFITLHFTGEYTLFVTTPGYSGTECEATASFTVKSGPTPSPEGQFCGGIAGLPCPDGYVCQLDGNYPDAGGKCIPKPTPTPSPCPKGFVEFVGSWVGIETCPTSIPKPTPSSFPKGISNVSGDGNSDGTVNLNDMSVLLTDFNKKENIRKMIDMNGDGLVNTFDFSLLRNLLIEKGIIKG